jgi:hypothetical protein
MVRADVFNVGILPHDGRGISFKELGRTVRTTYNFAPSFCYFVPNFAANMLGKNYSKGREDHQYSGSTNLKCDIDTFDLADLNLHSDQAIEHNASLCSEQSL